MLYRGSEKLIVTDADFAPTELRLGAETLAGWREEEQKITGKNLMYLPDFSRELRYPITFGESYPEIVASANALPRNVPLIASAVKIQNNEVETEGIQLRRIVFPTTLSVYKIGAYINDFGGTHGFTIKDEDVPETGFFSVWVYLGRGDPTLRGVIEGFQIERGTVATEFEPYGNTRVWRRTYNDCLSLSALGKGKQDGVPSPDSPVTLTASECLLKVSGNGKTASVKLPALRQIPGTDVRDTAEYIGGTKWKVTRCVGWLESYAGESMPEVWASTTGQLTDGVEVWYQLATPVETTSDLGVLPTYPQETTLEAVGDYLPEITARAKVAV